MRMKKTISFITLLFILTGCEIEEIDLIPTISLSSSTSSISIDEVTKLSLEITDLETEIFGIGLRISFNENIVEIDSISGISKGDFLGSNTISLSKINNNVLHFSAIVTEDATLSGSGTLFEFDIKGISAGTSVFTIINDGIFFIDKDGNEVIIQNLEKNNLEIYVYE